jgi:transcriptional repressor NrdR
MLNKLKKCPICNETLNKKKLGSSNLNNTSVIDSRVTKNGTMIRRRRMCSCGSNYRFTTYEKIEKPQLNVVKRNGQIIPFDRDRIYNSLKIALNGCVDELKKTEEISNEVYSKIQNLGEDSVPTKKIGNFILQALKEKDKIGYVRFYGVFKKIADPKEYKKIVDTLH